MEILWTDMIGPEDAMLKQIIINSISTIDHPQHMDVIRVIQIVYALLVALAARLVLTHQVVRMQNVQNVEKENTPAYQIKLHVKIAKAMNSHCMENAVCKNTTNKPGQIQLMFFFLLDSYLQSLYFILHINCQQNLYHQQ